MVHTVWISGVSDTYIVSFTLIYQNKMYQVRDQVGLSNVEVPIEEIIFVQFEGIKELTNTNGVCF